MRIAPVAPAARAPEGTSLAAAPPGRGNYMTPCADFFAH